MGSTKTTFVAAALLLCLLAGVSVVRAEDPYLFFEWTGTYGTISPLGVPASNPHQWSVSGPKINCTSNNNIVVNVFNKLDEPFLLTWYGIQQRKNSWQDGLMYPDQWQVWQGRWQQRAHIQHGGWQDLQVQGLQCGNEDITEFQDPRSQFKLVEMEGSHTVQNVYDSLDVHIGQCFSVLVEANQEPNDYYMVFSSRFTKQPLTSVAVIRYANGKNSPSSELPAPPPETATGIAWSINQFRSFRWNLTASAARPNPQGSYHYGKINITRTIKLVNSRNNVDGKLRYAINGVSTLSQLPRLSLLSTMESRTRCSSMISSKMRRGCI
ncbi:hypothetical protein LOK49_LG08G00240 [Camellia lanceoleosa]|uniref:Uncharacterized protein n=1 Tax=Camellia lanceoleosa TaxID=1840588 RepID=A0ACC0GMB6_9ERIC|nr:hypothetical protein LOK49_LG08G00240 [Camellia lanceoleosa]